MTGLTLIRKALGRSGDIGCIDAQELMSPFIDSMAGQDEVERLESHLSACAPCQRQLQSYISVKNLLLTADEPEVPVDLALVTRVRLSHERNENRLARLEMRLSNFLAPIALPAVAGVCFTVLFFGILLGSFAAPTTSASDDVADFPVSLYKRVRTTDPTMSRFAGDRSYLLATLTVETHVGDDGRVMAYVILSGPDDPEVERWLREQLYFARFDPATLFGKPVESKIILSFVGVTS